MASNAVVTSSHQLASFHGADVIRNGGNVFDALITTSSVLTVVQNNLCGIGGDLFALLRGKDGVIREINGSGRASRNATIDFYRRSGMDEIPDRGPLAGITVPGIVDAWGEINSKYGSMEISDLLKPAIEIAEYGYPLTRKYVQSIKGTARFLSDQKGWSSLFMPNGRIPGEGEVFKQRHLAESLKMIAEEGHETFYRGRLMEKIVKGTKENGG
ncbi:MAG TPA: gamma-glutamyltransferase, partial [Thermoplasmataceae archaeon]|nr:gamma-glutamyltransferase [Thermoplasmataceae archaeon]